MAHNIITKMPEDLDRKTGRFNLPISLIVLMPETVMDIMGKMIIIKAEYVFLSNSIEYVAISHLFEKRNDLEQTPNYNLIVKNGVISFEKVKV